MLPRYKGMRAIQMIKEIYNLLLNCVSANSSLPHVHSILPCFPFYQKGNKSKNTFFRNYSQEATGGSLIITDRSQQLNDRLKEIVRPLYSVTSKQQQYLCLGQGTISVSMLCPYGNIWPTHSFRAGEELNMKFRMST